MQAQNGVLTVDGQCEVLCADMRSPEAAAQVLRVLLAADYASGVEGGEGVLRAVAARAQRRALGWGEPQMARSLLHIVRRHQQQQHLASVGGLQQTDDG